MKFDTMKIPIEIFRFSENFVGAEGCSKRVLLLIPFWSGVGEAPRLYAHSNLKK